MKKNKKKIWTIIGGFTGLIALLTLIQMCSGITISDLLECKKQPPQDTTTKNVPISAGGNVNIGDGNINIDSVGNDAIIISQPNGNVEINKTVNNNQK